MKKVKKLQSGTPNLVDIELSRLVDQLFRMVSCELHLLEPLFATPVLLTGKMEATR